MVQLNVCTLWLQDHTEPRLLEEKCYEFVHITRHFMMQQLWSKSQVMTNPISDVPLYKYTYPFQPSFAAHSLQLMARKMHK